MSRQEGFSLVELMVGLFVSMLIVLVLMGSQMFFEASKRTMTGSANAVENAAISLYSIERDVRMAGLGLLTNGALACSSINIYYNGAAKANGATAAPVTISHTDGAPDELTILQSASLLGAASNQIIAGMPTPSSILKANSGRGLSVGSLILVANPNGTDPCTLMQVTHIQQTGFGTDIQHNPGQSLWNPPNPNNVFSNAPAYPAGSALLNVGTLGWGTYRVRNDALEYVDNITGQIGRVADNVVFLRAQYGVTNGASTTIDQWVDATSEWANLDSAHIRAIRAIRVGVIARSAHREKPGQDGQCNTTSEPPEAWPGGPVIDLSANPDWRCYRYRTFNIMVPLKNVIWGSE